MPIQKDDKLREVLQVDTIAVVGASTTPGKAAHGVPQYLIDHGYTVIPVNPYADEVFGIDAYDSLDDVEQDVDLVDVFRPSAETGPIVSAALNRDDVQTIWLQLGIRNNEAAERADAGGKQFVQDRCIKIEHERLLG
jgi:predicted CoA-binding protein